MNTKNNFIILMLTALVMPFITSCNDDDDKQETSITIEWNIDESQTIYLEDYIPGLDADCDISAVDYNVIKIEYDKNINKHVVNNTEYFGVAKPVVKTSSGDIYKLTIKITNDLFGVWEIKDIVTNIKCNDEIKDKVKHDLEDGNFIWNNADIFCLYERSAGRYWNNCIINYKEDKGNYSINFNCDRNSNEYTFFIYPNIHNVQTLKIDITSKEYIEAMRYYHKTCVMKYDITEQMKEKYGAEKVENASIEYHAESIKLM